MRSPTPWSYLSPSSTLLRFVPALTRPVKPVTLDLACGFGRHAILMAAHGCEVIGVDRDLARLRHLNATKSALLDQAPFLQAAGKITTVCADLSEALWPFAANSFDLIIIVHFVKLGLFPCALHALRQGGHLYFETFGGQGQNYLDLPRPGEVKAALGVCCDFKHYEERPSARGRPGAVAVKALVQKNEKSDGR
jgi:SAM-dependent methyltransferase